MSPTKHLKEETMSVLHKTLSILWTLLRPVLWLNVVNFYKSQFLKRTHILRMLRGNMLIRSSLSIPLKSSILILCFYFILFYFYLPILLLRNVCFEIPHYNLWIHPYIFKVLSIFYLSWGHVVMHTNLELLYIPGEFKLL